MENPLPSHRDSMILESMTQSILITTPELGPPGPYIIYANKAFEKMTGWAREELIGKTPRILQKPLIIEKMELNFSWNGQFLRYLTKMEELRV